MIDAVCFIYQFRRGETFFIAINYSVLESEAEKLVENCLPQIEDIHNFSKMLDFFQELGVVVSVWCWVANAQGGWL